MAKKQKTPKSPKECKTPLQKEFGKIVREKRLEIGISQEELAERADLHNLHFTYISSTERGERNISIMNIAKLTKALNCAMADLMPFE